MLPRPFARFALLTLALTLATQASAAPIPVEVVGA